MDYDRYIVVKEGKEGKPRQGINKTTIVLLAVLLILLILIVILLSGGQNNKRYTDENDFKIIKETPYITVYDNNIVSVPIERITNGQGEEGSYGDELVYVNGEQVLFYLYGMYEGEEISKSKYEVDEDGNITYYMRITKNLVPDDNVLDGYMLESLEENTPLHLYLSRL